MKVNNSNIRRKPQEVIDESSSRRVENRLVEHNGIDDHIGGIAQRDKRPINQQCKELTRDVVSEIAKELEDLKRISFVPA